MQWVWLESLTKPFASLLNPIAERIGNRLGRRRPRLHVHPIPTQLVWSIGGQRQPDGTTIELMHVHLVGAFTHDHEKQTIVIMDAFPEGTSNQIPVLSQFAIHPHELVEHSLLAFASPVIAARGKPWTGKLILVDQFHRRYKTQKMTFRFAGQPAPSVPVQPPKD